MPYDRETSRNHAASTMDPTDPDPARSACEVRETGARPGSYHTLPSQPRSSRRAGTPDLQRRWPGAIATVSPCGRLAAPLSASAAVGARAQWWPVAPSTAPRRPAGGGRPALSRSPRVEVRGWGRAGTLCRHVTARRALRAAADRPTENTHQRRPESLLAERQVRSGPGDARGAGSRRTRSPLFCLSMPRWVLPLTPGRAGRARPEPAAAVWFQTRLECLCLS